MAWSPAHSAGTLRTHPLASLKLLRAKRRLSLGGAVGGIAGDAAGQAAVRGAPVTGACRHGTRRRVSVR